MGYINGLRALYQRSERKASRLKGKKRPSTEKWLNALSHAESALGFLRKGAELAKEKKYKEAEGVANKGIEDLRRRLMDILNLT